MEMMIDMIKMTILAIQMEKEKAYRYAVAWEYQPLIEHSCHLPYLGGPLIQIEMYGELRAYIPRNFLAWISKQCWTDILIDYT